MKTISDYIDKDKLIIDMYENDKFDIREIENVEDFSNNTDYGYQIVLLKELNIYVLMHGQHTDSFNDYCNTEVFTNLKKAKKKARQLMYSNGYKIYDQTWIEKE